MTSLAGCRPPNAGFVYNPKDDNGLDAQRLTDELTAWLESARLPEQFYGKITVPIENGRVQLVIVEEKRRPDRVKPS